MSILFRIFRGLLYGSTIGLVLGYVLYLVTGAITQLWQNATITPGQMGYLTFAITTLLGVAREYGKWLEEKSK